jgi:hypothetical protein
MQSLTRIVISKDSRSGNCSTNQLEESDMNQNELERLDLIERLPIVSEGMHRMIEDGMKYEDWKGKLHGLVSTLIRYVAEKEGISFPNGEWWHRRGGVRLQEGRQRRLPLTA